jgi:hypothetical protein
MSRSPRDEAAEGGRRRVDHHIAAFLPKTLADGRHLERVDQAII